MRNSAIQSHLAFPLNAALGSPLNVRLLRALSTHGGALSVVQLARETSATPVGVRTALASLME